MIKKCQKPLILAIDTSCDDTCASVVSGLEILSNVIASQAQLHQKYGGVFPTVAKIAHKENIDACVREAIKIAKINIKDLSAVAVTQGPGLAPSLEIGIKYAQKFAQENSIKLIGINHIEGHALSVLAQPRARTEARIRAKAETRAETTTTRTETGAGVEAEVEAKTRTETGVEARAKTRTETGGEARAEIQTEVNNATIKQRLPALAVVVSGGHTQFILIKSLGQYQIVGETIDDAVGECLDKIGRMLNLGYPAGAIIEKLAKLSRFTDVESYQRNFNKYKNLKIAKKATSNQATNSSDNHSSSSLSEGLEFFEFPLPMTSIKNYDMSFSGLKTFARNKIKQLVSSRPLTLSGGSLTQSEIFDFCAIAQYSVFRHIIYKLSNFLSDQKNEEVKELWLGGGVASNIVLRTMLRKLAYRHNLKLKVPYSKKLCADNAGMIGIVASLKLATMQNSQIAKLEKNCSSNDLNINGTSEVKYQDHLDNAKNIERLPNWRVEKKMLAAY